jgi:membrane protein
MARRVVQKFLDDHGFRKAAALAYATLLSLIPFLAIAFSLFHAFGGLKLLEARVREIVFTHLIVDSGLEVVQYLNRFLTRINSTAVNALGVVMLVLTSASLLNAIANSFNEIWEVRERRSLQTRFTTFFTLIALTPLCFALSISATAQLQQTGIFQHLPYARTIGSLFFVILPLLFTWSGFILMYIVIPSTRVHLRDAAIGGFVAAVLWEISKLGFDVYVTRVISYSKIYGSLGVIPVFLTGLYVGWAVTLLGAEVTVGLQRQRDGRFQLGDERESRVMRAVKVLTGVASIFSSQGKPATSRELERSLGMPAGWLSVALDDLECHGFIAAIRDGENTYLPCQPPEAVSVADLQRAMAGTASLSSGERDQLRTLLTEAEEASLHVLAKTTIRDLIEPLPPSS